MTTPIIGTLSEKSLHKSLKDHYSSPGDLIETKFENYVIDIIAKDRLIEIQSGNFSSIKTKLTKLLEINNITLVYPIPKIKWIVRVGGKGNKVSRRKSPKQGKVVDLFRQLIYIPHLMEQSNFSLTIALVEIDEIWKDDGKGSWRRKGWSKADQILINIIDEYEFTTPHDLSNLIPKELQIGFTNRELASALRINYRTAQNMTYCLKHLEEIEITGKKGNSYLYRRTNN